MILTTEAVKKEYPVVITVERTKDGDVDILANGYKIAFIDSNDGTVVFYATEQDELRSIGFTINDNDEVSHN